MKPKCLLTVAGSDPSGGAGIEADIKTFSALGCYGMSVITSVVAENTERVISSLDMPPGLVGDQLDAVFEDIPPDAVKLGMIPNGGIAEQTARCLERYAPGIVVADPVMASTSGGELMKAGTVEMLKKRIFPVLSVLTPNIPEAEALSGIKIKDLNTMKAAAGAIHETGVQNVLVKGGHISGDPVDILFDGSRFYEFRAKRIDTKNTHGTGCTLSSAITAFLAMGCSVYDAVSKSKEYITGCIKNSFELGRGHGPLNHFYKFNQEV